MMVPTRYTGGPGGGVASSLGVLQSWGPMLSTKYVRRHMTVQEVQSNVPYREKHCTEKSA